MPVASPLASTLTRRSLLQASVSVVAAMAFGPHRLAFAADPAPAEDARLNAFLEAAFADELVRSPERQTYLGVSEAQHDRWDDQSEAVQAEEARIASDLLARLRANFADAGLSAGARLNKRLWEYRAELGLEAYRWRHHDYPIEHFNGRHSDIPSLLINFHPVRSETQAQAWITRVRSVGPAVDQLIERAEASERLGIVAPRFAVAKVLEATRGTIQGRPFDPAAAADSPILADIAREIGALDLTQDRKAALLAQATAALAESFAPAFRKLAGFVEAQLARATEDDGVWKLPDGDAYYQFCMKRHTTLPLDPSAVHDQGLAAVARIHGEIRKIMREVDFTGDLQDFFAFMRTDPRFYFANTPDGHREYIEQARAALADVEKVLDGQFGVKPKARVVVQRFEPYREASEAIARYSGPATDGSRPGIYYVNFSNMREMPKYQLEVLAFHEAIPGHHMQIAIAQEREGLPRFRRFGGQTAYTEGWALYSERLPKELGFYKDPYSDFGRLTFELWRAIRLVVDTGIHAKRWTRRQAIDYFVANSSFPEESAAREIDRYIVYPGQACAYYVGMQTILELREQARTALGDRFDIRAFHDTILKNGSVPLTVLREIVADWIDQTRA